MLIVRYYWQRPVVEFRFVKPALRSILVPRSQHEVGYLRKVCDYVMILCTINEEYKVAPADFTRKQETIFQVTINLNFKQLNKQDRFLWLHVSFRSQNHPKWKSLIPAFDAAPRVTCESKMANFKCQGKLWVVYFGTKISSFFSWQIHTSILYNYLIVIALMTYLGRRRIRISE